MKDILRLMSIVEERVPQDLPVLNKQNQNKEEELLEHLLSGDCENDDEAAALLYNTNGKDVRYKSLKYRLKQKLLNHLYFVDTERMGIKPAWKIEFSLLSSFLKARILLEEDFWRLGEKMLRKAFHQSQDAAFYDIAMLMASLLEKLYVEKGNYPAYKHLGEQMEVLQAKLQLEQEARKQWAWAAATLRKSYFARKNLAPQIEEHIKQLEQLWLSSHNYNIFAYYYDLKTLYYRYRGAYPKLLDFLQQVSSLQANELLFAQRFDIWRHRILELETYFQLFRIEEGLELAHRYAPLFMPQTRDWYDFYFVFVRLHLFAGAYEQAIQLIEDVFANIKQLRFDKAELQRWELLAAYVTYATRSSRLETYFNADQYYRQLPEYNRSQLSFHITLLILQFAWAVRQQDYMAARERIQFLQSYTNQKLRANVSPRTKLFFRMLKIMIDSDFRQRTTRIKGRYTYRQLQAGYLPDDDFYFEEWELLPYTVLWDLMVQDLIMEPMGKRGRPKKQPNVYDGKVNGEE